MGRVDEAMRRAADASANAVPVPDGSAERPAFDAVASGLPVDAFPAEAPERPKLKTVEPVRQQPGPAPKTTSVMALIERFGMELSRKVVVDHDTEPVSKEQYRRLATSLHAAQAASGLRVIMVASAVASEGKSLTAANLALTFSESYQKRVLLIDGDLRRPSLHKVFGLDDGPGLTEGLSAEKDEKLPVQVITDNLTFLPAGRPTSDPMAVLASDRMRRLVDEARDSFDWVLIDTPPVGLMADANLLAEIVDGAVLVVRAGSTPYDEVQRSVALLGKERVIGVVLNRAHAGVKTKSQYYSYYQASQRQSTAGS